MRLLEELIKDLTTKYFLLAFRRFVSRRVLCHVIHSDNARTFKTADVEIEGVASINSV